MSRENTEEIEGLNFRLVELNGTVSNQAITIHQLDSEVEGLTQKPIKNTSLQKH